jgi:uncharacterized protein (TIGR02118 family)
MVYVINVAYPSTPGARFELDYYINTHMPLVQNKWTTYGLINWTVSKYDQKDAPYMIMAVINFKDQAGYNEAQKERQELYADIPNFTVLKPTLFRGEQVGQMS